MTILTCFILIPLAAASVSTTIHVSAPTANVNYVLSSDSKQIAVDGSGIKIRVRRSKCGESFIQPLLSEIEAKLKLGPYMRASEKIPVVYLKSSQKKWTVAFGGVSGRFFRELPSTVRSLAITVDRNCK
jgi:hypothetical protein